MLGLLTKAWIRKCKLTACKLLMPLTGRLPKKTDEECYLLNRPSRHTVKELQAMSGRGSGRCKEALERNSWDIEKAYKDITNRRTKK